MDRKKIKAEARKLLKGNVWTLFKPYLVYLCINFGISYLVLLANIPENSWQSYVSNFMSGLILVPLMVGVYNYYLKFIRKEEYKINDIFIPLNYFIIPILIYIITTFLIYLGFGLFIVPGIILSLSFSMVYYLIVDGHRGIKEIMISSMKMMKGYKGNYFVFNLSFIGWFLLGVITLGLSFIYVIPYFNLANVLYYEELKTKKQ